MNLAKPVPSQTHGRRPSVRRMDRAEEAECVRRAKAGDHEAQTRLLRQYDRLVYKMASYYVRMRPGEDIEDLAQDGRMGILHAIRRFDLSVGTRFITYATHWIRNYARRTDSSGPIRVPVEAYKTPKLKRYADAAKNARSFSDNSFRFHDESDGAAEQWPDPKADDLLAVDRPEYDDLDAVRKAMAGLKDKRMRLVLEGRFIDGKTLQQVGDELGVSKERVRQIQVSAMETLRRAMGRGRRRRKAARPTLPAGG